MTKTKMEEELNKLSAVRSHLETRITRGLQMYEELRKQSKQMESQNERLWRLVESLSAALLAASGKRA